MYRYIGLDIGSKTVGIAISEGYFATPHSTIRFNEFDFEEAIQKLKILFTENSFEKIIVGYPINMNGSIGHRADMVDDFIYLMINILLIDEKKIVKIDERLTTKMANNMMSASNFSIKDKKQNKDQIAAKFILDSFLNNLK
ncbi:Holliday junction resolvase RuvX [Spiroplasma turonicum]|uniref:Putative pre-16S rRNA nuclease n=1 Tax=Spiroplasma turonicum TaxID=216946 RepID=A0A0K1P7A3_9MOLU|nr:Holliday junction resolvase RuvX [Spiroplasma turonicum]AKU80170.1 Holliday junction resolvase-like protein [Spiroplasma turonicum]ALX71170.1 Holliday junction resolvase-like protein [Spiroplasma turonicum]